MVNAYEIPDSAPQFNQPQYGWNRWQGIKDSFTGADLQRTYTEQMAAAQRDYDWQLTKRQWEREDNAVSRAVQDYENAGLNPILAVGGKGFASSSPISQNYGSMAVQSMANQVSARANGFDNLSGAMQGALNGAMALSKLQYQLNSFQKDINYKQALIDNINGKTDLDKQEYLFRVIKNPLIAQKLGLDISRLSTDDLIRKFDLDFESKTHDTRIELFNNQIDEQSSRILDFFEELVGDYLHYKIKYGKKGKK